MKKAPAKVQEPTKRAPARFPQLTRISVQNFRSIKRLDCALDPFSALVGANGAGKTNVVQAISLLGSILYQGTSDPAERWGWGDLIRRTSRRANHMSLGASVQFPPQALGLLGLDVGDSQSLTADLMIQLKASKEGDVLITGESLRVVQGPNSLDIDLSAEKVSVALGGSLGLTDHFFMGSMGFRDSLHPHLAISPAGDKELRAAEGAIQSLLALQPSRGETEWRYLRLLSLQRFYSPLLDELVGTCQVDRIRLDASALRMDANAMSSMGGAGQGLASSIAHVRGMKKTPKRAFQPVLEALQEIFPRVEDVIPVRVAPQRLALTIKERGVTEAFGQSGLSDGVLHALALLIGVNGGRVRRGFGSSQGLLAIEEPENAIHPWSIRVLMKRMQSRPSRQILITTHSPEVVNQVRDPRSLLICESTDEGTQVTPALEKEAALQAIMRETGQPLGEIWSSGTLGGIPGVEV